MRIEQGGKTYRDLGYNSYMVKPIESSENALLQKIKTGLMFGDLGDFIAMTKAKFSAGIDSESTLRIAKADGTQVFDVDTLNGWVNIGPDQPSFNLDPLVPLYVVKDTDSYMAVNIQNPSSGEYASCDIGCLNDIPSDVTSLEGLVDLGITSTNFADPDFAVLGPDNCYLWSGASENMLIGSAKSDGKVIFFTGGLNSLDYRNVEINSEGVLFPKQAPTASAPTYVKGGIYFDTTLNKMMIGGASGWETVTSS